jgi:uncharacterized membrane protein
MTASGNGLELTGVPPHLVGVEGHGRPQCGPTARGVESHARSIAKAVSYRVMSSLLIMAFAWLFTRQVGTALAIGAGDASLKICLFYLHERIWTRITFGRARPPDYQI